MRVFITGISGVLGSVLAKELRRRGHIVHGCDLAHSSDPCVFRADIRESRQLRDALNWVDGNSAFNPTGHGIDLLFHFAAEFGRHNGQHYYEDLWSTNCIGTRNVIEECIVRQIPMVFASSSEAYGASELYSNGEPLCEEMLDEFVPQFHSEYALSKYTNERQIFTAHRNKGLQAIILRFFNVYGPPERYSPYRSVVCQFTWKLLTNQMLLVNRGGKRSHLWIGDWANTVAGIADNKILQNLFQRPNFDWSGAAGTKGVPVFNLGGDEYETIEDLYRRLSQLIPESKSPVFYQDAEFANSPSKHSDNGFARAYLGHKPMMPFQDGLIKTVEWMRKIQDLEGL
jgi:dTDP-glucose 4,6-dehydratase